MRLFLRIRKLDIASTSASGFGMPSAAVDGQDRICNIQPGHHSRRPGAARLWGPTFNRGRDPIATLVTSEGDAGSYRTEEAERHLLARKP